MASNSKAVQRSVGGDRGVATATSLCLPFPLRGGAFMAQLVIPRDLKRHEAEGLSKFLHALVIPDGEAK